MTATETFSRAFTTLPREFYLEGLLFEHEVRRIWDRQWIFFPRTSDIPGTGRLPHPRCDRRGRDRHTHLVGRHPYWSTDVSLRAGAKSASITGEYVCGIPLASRDDFTRAQSRSSVTGSVRASSTSTPTTRWCTRSSRCPPRTPAFTSPGSSTLTRPDRLRRRGTRPRLGCHHTLGRRTHRASPARPPVAAVHAGAAQCTARALCALVTEPVSRRAGRRTCPASLSLVRSAGFGHPPPRRFMRQESVRRSRWRVRYD